jgi:hypothetical protein
MDKLKGAIQKVQVANIVEKGSSTEAPSAVMVAVRCRPCTPGRAAVLVGRCASASPRLSHRARRS